MKEIDQIDYIRTKTFIIKENGTIRNKEKNHNFIEDIWKLNEKEPSPILELCETTDILFPFFVCVQ